MPFLTVLDPAALIQMLQGLLTLYSIQGWLPDCHMSLDKGFTQGGSNADVVMADAYVKLNGTKLIDWNLAYEAVKKDAEVEPYGKSKNQRCNKLQLTDSQIGAAKVEAVSTVGRASITFQIRISTTRDSGQLLAQSRAHLNTVTTTSASLRLLLALGIRAAKSTTSEPAGTGPTSSRPIRCRTKSTAP